jgi:C1A family cysteine protease
MKHSRFHTSLTFVLLSFLLSACGGGGGGDDGGPTPPSSNNLPTVNAGSDLTSDEDETVTLSGTATDSDGTISSYNWTQTAGTSVTINNSDTSSASFTSPRVFSQETLVFQLTVTDNSGGAASDSVQVVVENNINEPPIAEDLTFTSNLSTPFVQVNLVAEDPNRDTIIYAMNSEFSGSGYSQAFIQDDVMYITLTNVDAQTAEVSYRASDGQDFSESAKVTVVFDEIEENGTGAEDFSPEDYAQIPRASFDGSTYTDENGNVVIPASIDLSGLFPLPGDQGNQNSCVGWALGYAIKTYQEKVQYQWDLTLETTFSPAFIYNQINGGNDTGSNPLTAFNLLQSQGVASLSTMPYNQQDYTSQPTQTAIDEASLYKVRAFSKIESIDSAKAALANQVPIYGSLRVYQSFSSLASAGENALYNSFIGGQSIGHAVVVVGYDDNKFGGAFKIMNSYGQSWGDNGFFWVRYNDILEAFSAAAILVDDQTANNPNLTINVPIQENRPNLVVRNWNLFYEPSAGGNGELYYEVVNDGLENAPSGVDVMMIISEDQVISSADTLLTFEEIPFELEPGSSAVRDETNENPFTFNIPNTLQSGQYYLAMIVDGVNEVLETNENDNISLSDGTIELSGLPLPDLSIETWFVDYAENGDASIEYKVPNTGEYEVADLGWDISVVLHETPDFSGNYYFSFVDFIDFTVPAGNAIFRDESNAGTFNLFRDYLDNPVPNGSYYVSLVVDSTRIVDEKNETNNVSTSYNRLQLSTTTNSKSSIAASEGASHRAFFNGRGIDNNKLLMKKVLIADVDGVQRIVDVEDIQRTMPSGELASKPGVSDFIPTLPKTLSSDDIRIAPILERKPMPNHN